MTEPSKLEQIVARCKCSVTVTVDKNERRHLTVKDYIGEKLTTEEFDPEDIWMLVGCIEAGRIWEVYCYRQNITTMGGTLDAALDAMGSFFDNEDRVRAEDDARVVRERAEDNAKHCPNCTRFIGPMCPDKCSVLD